MLKHIRPIKQNILKIRIQNRKENQMINLTKIDKNGDSEQLKTVSLTQLLSKNETR